VTTGPAGLAHQHGRRGPGRHCGQWQFKFEILAAAVLRPAGATPPGRGRWLTDSYAAPTTPSRMATECRASPSGFSSSTLTPSQAQARAGGGVGAVPPKFGAGSERKLCCNVWSKLDRVVKLKKSKSVFCVCVFELADSERRCAARLGALSVCFLMN
jgi:hypothetical protein